MNAHLAINPHTVTWLPGKPNAGALILKRATSLHKAVTTAVFVGTASRRSLSRKLR